MSQRRRKYRFNIIDHLHYVAGWERLHNYFPKYREHITPLEDVLFFAVPVLALPFSVFFSTIYSLFAFSLSGYAVVSLVIYLLDKYRFTPARERAYYRRYPQRKDGLKPYWHMVFNFAGWIITLGIYFFIIVVIIG